MKYRPEIDGIRAVAVLSVVIYHAKFTIFGIAVLSGGFIGVDVFFVISGYLITSIILREVQQGTFRFADFYERRARRILPALFAVMLVSVPFAWAYLLPDTLKEYALSLLSSLAFFSNVLFWLQDSYTATPSELKPFLHTWSLSVEEQFYVFFPIVLLLLSRFMPQRILFCLWTVFAISLMLAQFGSRAFSDANFFLLPSRGWELMAGALLAKMEMQNSPALRKASSAWVVNLALFILVVSLFLFTESTAHPSLLTVFPVLVTVLLIANRNTELVVVRLLASPVMVFVGLISYSLYLWHFPIFAFARIRGVVLDSIDKIVMIVMSVMVAVLAYYCIEKPLRNRVKWSAKQLMVALSFTFMALVVIQSYFYLSGGATQRLGSAEALFKKAKLIGVANGEQNISDDAIRIVNIGDSHSGIFANSALQLAKKYQTNFTKMEAPGCPLAPGIYLFDNGKLNPACSDRQSSWFKKAYAYRESIFIYSARFTLYFEGKRFDNGEGGLEPGSNILITDNKQGQANIEGVKHIVQNLISRLLDNDNKVVLVYPIPEVGWNVPKLVQEKLLGVAEDDKIDAFESLSISTSLLRYKQRSRHVYDMYDTFFDSLNAQQKANVIRVYPSDFLCSEKIGRCFAHNNRRLFYYDHNHLSPFAASQIIGQLEQQMLKRHWLVEPVKP